MHCLKAMRLGERNFYNRRSMAASSAGKAGMRAAAMGDKEERF
jgi:hypothetical protein